MYAKGPFQVDYQARVDFQALRAYRLRRAWQAMEEAGLDALLVWKDENVRYLTSLRPQLIAGKSGLLNGALLLAGREPILLVSGGDHDRALATMPWLLDVRPIPILEEKGLIEYTVRKVLGDLLGHYGLRSKRIGYDLASAVLFAALRDHFPDVQWEDGDTVMQQARMIKGPEELVLIEEATAMAEAVTQVAMDAVQVGRRECEVAAVAMETLFRLGGEYAHVTTPFVSSGENMSPPTRLATDKLIRHGDIVFIDIGVMWNGYFADLGRTVICGEPSTRQREIYQAVYEAHMAGIEAMRPGATNREVAEVIRRKAADHGLAERFLTLFIGHGIGAGSNEPPYIGEVFPGSAEVELRPGMVFAMEPLIWVPGVKGGGGVRLEDMVVITEKGPRRISRLPYDARLLRRE
ncbi:MAG: Xaa-Pro peptidase family protein [Armatimonadota bacterium]|nr:Xaa-Pro peptidase family protein [Armatimonadota bacterium]